MFYKILLLSLFFCTSFFQLYSQCNQPFPPAATCSTAPVLCDLDGYCSATNGPNAIDVPPTFCGNVENNQWLAFTAGSASLSLYISVSNCSNPHGLQAQIFATNDCQNFTAVSNCWSPAYVTDGQLNASGLVVGQTYYLMFDGWSVAQCDYSIIVLSGTTGAGIVANAGNPTSLCPGSSLVLDGSGSSVGANYSYQWTSPDGNIVSGANTLTPSVDQPGTYILEVTNTQFGCSKIASVVVTAGNVPVAAATALEELNCDNPSIMLSGDGSSEGDNFTYKWTTNDGNIMGADNTLLVEVDAAGTYALEVMSQPDNCSTIASLQVTGDFDLPLASASTEGVLGCDQNPVQLIGQSNTPNVTYVWEGPSGFISEEASPQVFEGGTYTLNVTGPNGCTTTTSTVVEEDFEIPNAQATGGVINCNQNSTQLFGNSSTANVTYSWAGPNNFSSNEQNPAVFEGGNYTLIVTAANGCEAIVNAFVEEDFSFPNGEAAGGTLGCGQNNLQLQAVSSTPNVSYTWTGPSGFFSTQQNPGVFQAGLYQLTITGANGCQTLLEAVVIEDQSPPDLTADGGMVNCLATTVELSAHSNTADVTYNWVGPNGFTATIPNPIVEQAGFYTVIATAANQCETALTVEVTEDTTTPDVEVVGGTLTCQNPIIQVTANSSTPNATFQWSGPDNFSAEEANPFVQNSGIYYVTVTAPNGCTEIGTTNVAEDMETPVIAAQAAPLNCQNTNTTIITNTNINIDYAWTGPNNFSSTDAEPLVNDAGIYFLTATAANGCATEVEVEVLEDTTAPDAIATGGTLNCNVDAVLLEGSSSQSNVTYQWAGPNDFASNLAQVETTLTGEFTLTVTGANGCTNTATAFVDSDFEMPDVEAIGGELTCNDNEVMLQAVSTTSGVTYVWEGPNGFYSEATQPLALEVGEYQLTATAPNGCTNTTTAQVSENTEQPTAMATGGELTCSENMVTLTGSSGTEGAEYEWTGPNGFEAVGMEVTTGISGEYNLVVTAPNGCTNIATTNVIANTDLPDIQANGNSLTCASPMAELVGQSNTANVTYQWTGPNNFTANTPSIMASDTGLYQLTITAPNNCAAVAEVSLLPASIPDLSLNDGVLTCAQSSLILQANSSATIMNYEWTGPNDFLSEEATPVVEEPGTYQLTVTADNACTHSVTLEITSDTQVPVLTVEGGTLTCSEPTVQLQSLSENDNLDYNWTGPNGFASALSNPVVAQAGEYTLTATASNGCSTTLSTMVEQNQEMPEIVAFDDTLNCVQTVLVLQTETNSNIATFEWTGPNGFASNLPQPEINQSGEYVVTMTLDNGCTNQDTAFVTADFVTPSLEIMGETLTCTQTELSIQSVSNTENLLYAWTGPNSFSANTAAISISEGGIYQLTITASNGCTQTETIEILEDTALPNVVAIGGTLDCLQSSINLQGNSETAVSYHWTGPNNFEAFEANPLVNEPGEYWLTVTATNGCTATAMASVEPDSDAPQIVVQGGEQTCAESAVELQVFTNSTDLNFSWTGPNGFESSQMTPTVSLAGDYTLTVTADNGCTATATGVVNPPLIPSLSISGLSALSCATPAVQLMSESNVVGLQYEWTGPNGFQSTQANPTVNEAGLYVLTVTAANACTAVANFELLSDNTPPDLNASSGSLTCTSPEIELQALSTTEGVSFEWNGPNNFESTEANPMVSQAGTYHVIASAPNGCQTDTSVVVIADMETPEVQINQVVITCLNPQVPLEVQTDVIDLSYVWEGPEGWGSEATTPVVEVPGEYQLTATAANGCSTIAMIEVAIDTISPNISATAGQLSCAITSTLITTTGTANNYHWTGPMGFESEAAEPVVHQAGFYQLLATADNGCTTSTTVEVIADTIAPTAQAGEAGFLDCEQQTIQLNGEGSSAGAQYRPTWFTSNGSILSGQQTYHPTVDRGGLYILEVANIENGCVASDTVEVTESENILRFAFFEVDKPSCFDSSDGLLRIDSVVGGVMPLSFSLDGVPFSENGIVDSLAAGLYELTVRDAEGCEWTTEAEIDAPFRWTVSLGSDRSIEETGAFRLEPELSILEFPIVDIQWTPSDGLSCDDCMNPLVLPSKTTTYTLALTNFNGCTVTDEITVTVGPGQEVFIPNAFSPNADGYNERLTVYGGHSVREILKLDIFDVYGRPVYQAQNFAPNDESAGWDGNFRGQPLNNAVFVYVTEVLFDDGQVKQYKGSFALAR